VRRVGKVLARGIPLAVVLLSHGRLSDFTVSRSEAVLCHVRLRDFAPVVELAGERVHAYFASRDEQGFLDDLFGVSGKWKALTRGPASYDRFVRRTFEKRLVNTAELDGLLAKIRSDYAYAAAASDNRLSAALTENLRLDRPGLAIETVRNRLDRLAARMAPVVLRDLGMNAVSIAGSEAASILLTSALGSAGILGTSATAGGAAGAWSFGIGLAVGVAAGLVIDAVVSGAWEEAARSEVRAHLDGLRNRVIGEVSAALWRAAEAHVELQRRCVRLLIEGGEDERLAGRR
jgi:hypothetical protein